MRILTITSDHISEVVGGTRVYAHELNKHLARKGDDVIHFCFESSSCSMARQDNVLIIKRQKIEQLKPVYYVTRLKAVRSEIRRLWADLKPDVLCFHSAPTAQFLLGLGIPKDRLVYFVHAMNSHEIIFDSLKLLRSGEALFNSRAIGLSVLYWPLVYLLEELALKISGKIITMSEFDRREITRYHGMRHDAKIEVVPIGIDLERFAPCGKKYDLRKELGIPDNKVIFLVIRRLAPRMGLANLIEAFAMFRYRRESLLLIGGKGELAERLRNKVADCNLTNEVRFLGFLDEEIKRKYLQAADFFVLPTEALEGFGIVILEALSCNLPVIATPIGAIPEILNPLDRCLLTNDQRPRSIADKLEWAFEHKAQLCSTYRYRKYAEQYYDWIRITDRIRDKLKRH